MRVLVTGYQGYIGSALMPMLLARGHSVLGIDCGFFIEKTVRAIEAHPAREMNIDTRKATADHVRGADAVIHLAALSNDPMGEIDPSLTDEINHRATVRLARLAREAGVRRFVFSSSCSLYGAAGTERPLDETAPMRPVTAYARSKMDAEAGLFALADATFSPTYLRNATAMGLSSAMRFDLVVNNLTGWALTQGAIRLRSDGTAWRPLVHVEDIARACVAVIEAPRDAIHNEAFNIGRDDQNFRIRDIAQMVAEAVPGSTIEMAADAGPDRRTYHVSFEKAARGLPDFAPQWTVQRTIRQIVDFFQERGLTEDEFQGRPYVRLKQLNYLLESGQVNGELYWRRQDK